MTSASEPHGTLRLQSGRCPTHGVVQATKVLPPIRFPFLIFGALRLWANLRPFRCPLCDAAVAPA